MSTVKFDTASRLDVICRRGDTFNIVIDFGVTMPPHDPPGSQYTMAVRTSADNTGTAFFSTFSFDFSEGDATSSKLTISATGPGMALTPGTYVYALPHQGPHAGVQT